MQYYGRFYRSALYPLLSRINAYLMPVTRDCHAGICGSRRVRLPPATQQLLVSQDF